MWKSIAKHDTTLMHGQLPNTLDNQFILHMSSKFYKMLSSSVCVMNRKPAVAITLVFCKKKADDIRQKILSS